MIRFAWFGLIALTVSSFTGLVYSDKPLAPAQPVSHQPLGSVGCSASACHGKPETKALTDAPGPECWKSSAVIVQALDPHRRAYEALFTPLAIEMARKLRTGIPAHEDVRCLACHTNPALAKADLPKEWIALRREGVSCEGCHGNASGWVAEHTAWPNWNARLPFYDRGFHELNIDRAKVCAGCHVGAPATANAPVRDMNHDMIAAGHPALDASYEDLIKRLPHHWQEKNRGHCERKSDAKADFKKAMKLLHDDRMKRSPTDPRTPWPELAEMDCTACHHNLK